MGESREEARRDWRSWVTPCLLLVWGVGLLIAYAIEHPVPESSVEFVGATNDGPGLWTALLAASRAVSTALAILAASVGYGGLLSRLGLGSLGFGRTADVCAELMLGGGILAVAVFGLGHAGVLTAIPAFVLLAGGWAALAFVHSRPTPGRDSMPARGSAISRWDPVVLLAFAGVGAAFLLALVTALAPPTARDALSYHLAAPKAYIAANGIVELPWSVHSYVPFAAEMLFLLGLIVGPDTSPNLVHLGYGVAVTVLVVVVTRRATGSRRWAAVAGLMFAAVPSVIWNAGIAHNEMWMALAVTVAAVALGRWWETGDRRLLIWTGTAVGIALSAKHTALLLAPILAVIVLLRMRSSPQADQIRTVKTAVVAGLVAVVFPLPWYLQNIVRTGNPVFPYFWNVFPTHSTIWDAARAELFETYLRLSYGQPGGVLSWARLPWDVSVRAQNDVTSLFDGVVGPTVLFLAPVVLLAFIRTNAASWLRIATVVAVVFVVVWSTQSQQIRFLVPVLPILAMAGAYAASELKRWSPSSGLVLALPLAGMLVVNLTVATLEVRSGAPHRPVLGLESRATYLARRLPYLPFYDRLNVELGASQRVLLVNMRNDGYYLDVPFVSDSVLEDYTVGRIVNDAATPEAVRDAIGRLGVTHLLIREDILLDPRFTPFNDAPAVSRWSAFLKTSAERVESRNGIALYALKI